MKYRYALILTVLLTHTAPLWAMEEDSHQATVAKLKQNIKEVNERTNIDPSTNKVIILGSTGAGKSVLLNYLAEKRLEGKKNPLGGPRILEVEDPLPGSNIGHGLESGTTLPFSWAVSNNNNVTVTYWDCPGFDDTRGNAQEIVNAFAIHRLIQGPTKIVLVVPESALQEKQGTFLKFLDKITEAFPQNSIENFKGFFLVLTKQRDYEISNTLAFLLENSNGPIALLQNKNVKELLQYFKNTQHFTHFPYPKEGAYPTGHRVKILDIINQANFVTRPSINPPVSSEAKILAGKLATQLNLDIKDSLGQDVAMRFMDCCIRKVDQYSNPLKDENQFTTFLGTFGNDLKNIMSLEPNNLFITLQEFFVSRRTGANDPHLSKDKDTILNMNNTVENIKFLQKIDSGIPFNTDGWSVALQPTLDKVNNFFNQPKTFYQMAADKNFGNAYKALGIMHENGTWVLKNMLTAVEWYQKAAEQGLVPIQVKLGGLYLNGLPEIPKNDFTAFYWFKKAADRGHILSQYNVAVMYETGTGVTKSSLATIEWYTKAADQGHAPAQNNLGVIYEKGIEVPLNPSIAVDWYAKAANQGYAPAQHNLGVMYETGTGIVKDLSKAADWYTKAANQGYKLAQHNLGLFYEKGTGVPLNPSIAADWYTKAANQYHAPSQHNLGMMYEKGTGVSKNLSQAVKWYTDAANQGHALAQYNLGVIYEAGMGVPKNLSQAVKWYTDAANQEHVFAQYNLGVIYEAGIGVPKNDSIAADWYTKAANQEHALAQHNLGVMYEKGAGVTKNASTAFMWFEKAAKKKFVNAQVALGFSYLKGIGTQENDSEAIKWFEKAAEQGHIHVQYILGDMHKREGLLKNDKVAFMWFEKAAQQSHALAQYEVGLMYLNVSSNNNSVISKNIPEAISWLKKAAEQNLVDACLKLGNIYLNGEGVTKNEPEASKWFTKASEKGHNGAKKILTFLKKLT